MIASRVNFPERFSKKKWRILTTCFFTVTLILIGQTLLSTRSVNDTWVLEGLFLSFVVFTILYFVIVSFSTSLGLVAIITSIFLLVLNSIPLLKYEFIYGFFDPLSHHEFCEGIVMTGYVPDNAYHSVQYGHTPGSQTLAASLSIITGVNSASGLELSLAVSTLLLPLVVYLVARRLQPPFELSRCIIVATALVSPILYRFTGTVAVFSILFLAFYLSLTLAFSRHNPLATFAAAILVGVRIVVSHDVTSFFLTICLLAILILQSKIWHSKPNRMFTSFSLSFIILSLGYSMTVSRVNFNTIWLLVRNSFESLFLGRTPEATTYYSGFFTLSLVESIAVTLVRYGKEIVSILLSVLAPLALLRLSSGSDRLRTFYRALIPCSLLAGLAFTMTLFIRARVMTRGLIYFAAFSPFLVGITLFWVFGSRKFRFKRVTLGLVFLTLFSISLIQHYPCQPLIPEISGTYGSHYVMDLRAVNSLYKRSMIFFVNQYNSRLTIFTDPVTSSQIQGIGSQSTKALVNEGSTSQIIVGARLVLVSYNGVAHVVSSGRSAIQYYDSVKNATSSSSVVYTNGKSLVLFATAPSNQTLG